MLPQEYERLKDVCVKDPTAVIRSPFIVKPVGGSRGRGIFIATRVGKCLSLIIFNVFLPQHDEIPLASPQLVCRYISNPYLLDDCNKFDIRLYVAVMR